MLKQQINLYHPFELPLPDAAFITWRQFLIGNAAMLGFLLFIYLVMLIQFSQISRKETMLSNERLALQSKFYTNKSKYPSLFFSEDLQQTLQQMEKIIAAQSKFFNAISHPAPFSQKLLGLATIDQPSIWLTDISISNIDKKTVLKGKSNSASDLQIYLANLAQSPSFNHATITMNDVESDDNKQDVLSFEITMANKS